jgi:hypothetical protein
MHDYHSGQRYLAIAGVLIAIRYLLVAMAACLKRNDPARSFAITVSWPVPLCCLPMPSTSVISVRSPRGSAALSREASLTSMLQRLHTSTT